MSASKINTLQRGINSLLNMLKTITFEGNVSKILKFTIS